MRRAAFFVLLACGLTACGSADGPDCATAPDWAAFRAVSHGPGSDGEVAERTRRAVADHLVACNDLAGAPQARVRRLLGRPEEPNDETPADERDDWAWYLGPDWLHIDDEYLEVTFDVRGRAAHVAQGQH